jgi:hypothetical protein
MKECDNSTCKIHISSKFILSISLLMKFDTLLLRPSLHCNTPLHFTTLHQTTLHYTSPHFNQLYFTTLHYTSLHFTTLQPTTLHYTYRHFTSSHLHFTTLSFSITHLHFLSFYFTSHHYTRHSTVLISKLFSRIMDPFTALKNFSTFYFTLPFILFNFWIKIKFLKNYFIVARLCLSTPRCVL